MQANVQSIHFDADASLLSFVQERIGKLNQFYDHIIESDVYLRLDKSDVKQNKVAEIKVSLPGKDIFAKKQCASFEEACDSAIEAVRRQITKFKGKQLETHA